eukprot:GSChrysophyteH2.ASY1.ANO1.1654.1 assembled CDS
MATRIVKETKRLLAEPVEGVSATPYEDNMRYFNVAIAGPMDSPFEGGLFRLELLGRICLDILKDKWSPALQIRTVLISIQALLSAPNPDDPLDNNVADHWKRDEADACATSREWTRMYAS